MILGFWTVPSHAFWIWTPESGKWTNPKNTVKDTPKDQLSLALELYQSKDYKKANEELQKLLKTYPRAREAADAQYYLALILEDQVQLMAAFKNYQIVIDKFPSSPGLACLGHTSPGNELPGYFRMPLRGTTSAHDFA